MKRVTENPLRTGGSRRGEGLDGSGAPDHRASAVPAAGPRSRGSGRGGECHRATEGPLVGRVAEQAGSGLGRVAAGDRVVADAGRHQWVQLEDSRELGSRGGREDRQVVDGHSARQQPTTFPLVKAPHEVLINQDAVAGCVRLEVTAVMPQRHV